jgi:Flp pilus assembly pilin Flp
VLQHLTRLIVEDNGDDLVEYMLLAALVGTAGSVVLSGLPAIMNAVFASWDAAANNLWEPDDPTP